MKDFEQRKKVFLKDAELRLISQLMKNSRRSDRELAKVIGVSQPTISRGIKKLEQKGYIKEYTIIPDFAKLGFQMLSFTLVTLQKPYPQDVVEEKRKAMRERLKKKCISEILAMSGTGLGANTMLVAFHEDYASYIEYKIWVNQHPLVDVEKTQSFVVDLKNRSHFRSLSFSELAKYIAETCATPRSGARDMLLAERNSGTRSHA
jgi:DNA-binding Lrp family transcriptional regulator